MDKGFIFTLEALFSIMLLISSVIIIGGYDSQNPQDVILTTQTYGKTMNSIYFNKSITNSDSNNLFCVDFIDFELNDVNLCEGYSE
jgi:hypothetical protein